MPPEIRIAHAVFLQGDGVKARGLFRAATGAAGAAGKAESEGAVKRAGKTLGLVMSKMEKMVRFFFFVCLFRFRFCLIFFI